MLNVLIAVWIVVGVIASINMGGEMTRDLRYQWRQKRKQKQERKR